MGHLALALTTLVVSVLLPALPLPVRLPATLVVFVLSGGAGRRPRDDRLASTVSVPVVVTRSVARPIALSPSLVAAVAATGC
jgi:hypothetical protein